MSVKIIVTSMWFFSHIHSIQFNRLIYCRSYDFFFGTLISLFIDVRLFECGLVTLENRYVLSFNSEKDKTAEESSGNQLSKSIPLLGNFLIFHSVNLKQ